MRHGACACASSHLQELQAISGQQRELCRDSRRLEILIGNQRRSACLGEKAGVVRLVIVDGVWERYEQRADAGGGELCDGERAGSTDHEVSPSIGASHVVDKSFDTAIDAGERILGPRFFDTALACLVPHLEAVPLSLQQGERARHAAVQAPGAEAPTNDQETYRATAYREA